MKSVTTFLQSLSPPFWFRRDCWLLIALLTESRSHDEHLSILPQGYQTGRSKVYGASLDVPPALLNQMVRDKNRG
jgi:hypothetical protein